MTFFRRHWPDLVISLLIVALLGGFAFVLLGDQTRSGGAASGVTPPNPVQNSTVQSAPQSQAGAPSGADTASEAPSDQLPTIAGQGDGSPVVVTPSVGASGQEAAGAAPTPADSMSAKSAQASPTSTNPVPTSRADTPTRADYRLSAGVFADEAAALAATRAIADEGYTVHIIPIASGVVAQVGPFADRDTATKARDDIQRVFPSMVLYAPVGEPATDKPNADTLTSDSATSDAGDSDAAKPGAAPASQDAAQQSAAQPATPDSYLQVGAFARQDNAAPLVEKLRAEGFSPTVNAPPGQQVRVLVGPFGPGEIGNAEGKLSGMGLEHFRVR